MEDFIPGDDEYAVDMFYDALGTPIILDIQYHPLPKSPYFFILHYTSKKIINELYDQLITIFNIINKDLNARDLPVHAEFKLVGDKLVPIELNILRFGGFGFGDITYHIFGTNPFKAFFNSTSFNIRETAEKTLKNSYGGMFLCYNPDGVNTFEPDHEKMQHFLADDLIEYIKMDYKSNPVFAIAYFKTISKKRLKILLSVEF